MFLQGEMLNEVRHYKKTMTTTSGDDRRAKGTYEVIL